MGWNGPGRSGMGRNKRPRVLGDHPRHFLGTLGRLERLGTIGGQNFKSPGPKV